VAGALRGMGAVAAGLVIATALKLSVTLKKSPLGPRLCALFAALTFAGVGLLRWPLVWVLLGLGGTACAVAWHRVGKSP
jgi:chromate transporter